MINSYMDEKFIYGDLKLKLQIISFENRYILNLLLCILLSFIKDTKKINIII